MKCNVTYFKYTATGKESIKTELHVGKTRLINLLNANELFTDVFHVCNADTDETYLDCSEGKSLLLDDLNHNGVNGIFG